MLMFFRFSTESQVTNGYMYAFINDFIMKNHDAQIWQTLTTVSYTHLTLPTICSV